MPNRSQQDRSLSCLQVPLPSGHETTCHRNYRTWQDGDKELDNLRANYSRNAEPFLETKDRPLLNLERS